MIAADCSGCQQPVQTWFSATLCLSLGLYAFIVYDQVVLPNRGIDNRLVPIAAAVATRSHPRANAVIA